MVTKNALGAITLENTQQDVLVALNEVCLILENILSRQGFADPATAAIRANVINTVPVTVSSGVVTTVSTLSAIGTLNAAYDQYAQMQISALELRNRVAVS